MEWKPRRGAITRSRQGSQLIGGRLLHEKDSLPGLLFYLLNNPYRSATPAVSGLNYKFIVIETVQSVVCAFLVFPLHYLSHASVAGKLFIFVSLRVPFYFSATWLHHSSICLDSAKC